MPSPPELIPLDDLTLRCFEGEADLAELFRVIEESLDHLRPWMPWVAEHSLDTTRDFLARRTEQWENGDAYTYAIVTEQAIVGACQLFRRADRPSHGMEIGYWLHPAATGRGLVTRAARALVEQAFLLPGVDHVEIVHDSANRASGAVPRRLGFVEHACRPAERLAPAETGEDKVWRLPRSQARTAPHRGRGGHGG
ncbi:GNAT family N-acetyltransferase [Kitasatospora sp. NPDC058218]|uniref:GNAT family N-acetyltransferase n=1 Tax=Kitasatospora sp. NPDC058218 TaxID=3346385 RepID=UPI0036D82AB0